MKRATALLMTAIAAITVASAAAAARPDDQAGLQGVGRTAAIGQVVTGDNSGNARGPGAIASATYALLRPDDRARAHGPGAISPQRAASTAATGFDSNRQPLTRAAFLKTGNAICTKAIQGMHRIGITFFKSPGHPTKAETIAFAKNVAVPTAQHELDRIRALRPPKGDERRVDAFLVASQAAIDNVRANPNLLGGNNGSDRANRLARAYGLTACAT